MKAKIDVYKKRDPLNYQWSKFDVNTTEKEKYDIYFKNRYLTNKAYEEYEDLTTLDNDYVAYKTYQAKQDNIYSYWKTEYPDWVNFQEGTMGETIPQDRKFYTERTWTSDNVDVWFKIRHDASKTPNGYNTTINQSEVLTIRNYERYSAKPIITSANTYSMKLPMVPTVTQWYPTAQKLPETHYFDGYGIYKIDTQRYSTQLYWRLRFDGNDYYLQLCELIDNSKGYKLFTEGKYVLIFYNEVKLTGKFYYGYGPNSKYYGDYYYYTYNSRDGETGNKNTCGLERSFQIPFNDEYAYIQYFTLDFTMNVDAEITNYYVSSDTFKQQSKSDGFRYIPMFASKNNLTGRYEDFTEYGFAMN